MLVIVLIQRMARMYRMNGSNLPEMAIRSKDSSVSSVRPRHRPLVRISGNKGLPDSYFPIGISFSAASQASTVESEYWGLLRNQAEDVNPGVRDVIPMDETQERILPGLYLVDCLLFQAERRKRRKTDSINHTKTFHILIVL